MAAHCDRPSCSRSVRHSPRGQPVRRIRRTPLPGKDAGRHILRTRNIFDYSPDPTGFLRTMQQQRDGVVFIGVGGSTITRHSDRGIMAFALDAAVAAIADAGLTRDDIDGYVGAPTATNAGTPHVDGADEVWSRSVVNSLGISGLAWAADLHRAFPTDMAITAAHALRSGACRYVLGVRAMYNLPDANREPPAFAVGADQFRVPFGLHAAGARFATRASAYLARTGATRRDLYEVVALARRNAARNPLAIWRDRPVTLEDYLAAPMIAEPLCRLDCDMPVCAAAAFVMARGGDIPSGASQSAWLHGVGGWQRPQEVFAAAGLKPSDIHCAQLYDGFASMMFEFLELFGFCPPDTAWKFLRDGAGECDGTLPLNSFGGSLGEGRLHGMGHVREGILQVSGRAGARQLPRAANCLVQVGPFDSSSCLILGSEP
jgi:acetyl-CoA acetyltransferase